MPPSLPRGPEKRRSGRARKKQKRLDAIVEKPSAAAGRDPPRRSSRVCRRPVILDSSPALPLRRIPVKSSNSSFNGRDASGRRTPRANLKAGGLEGGTEVRRFNLRSGSVAARIDLKRKPETRSSDDEEEVEEEEVEEEEEEVEEEEVEEEEEEEEEPSEELSDEKVSAELQKPSSRKRKRGSVDDDVQDARFPLIDGDADAENGVRKGENAREADRIESADNSMEVGGRFDRTERQGEELNLEGNDLGHLEVRDSDQCHSEQSLKVVSEDLGREGQPALGDGEGDRCNFGEGLKVMEVDVDKDGEEEEDQQKCEGDVVSVHSNVEKQMEDTGAVANSGKDEPSCENVEPDGDPEENRPGTPTLNDETKEPRVVKEGRRCGLCGGGNDGRPPKKLVLESTDSDNEAYEGSSVSEEPNYNIWDGFGDDPGWIGRLLGPIRDRFGIARVWVHQHCAVWSPEVYFAGLGCLKNVRAALCRGRTLKCSCCGRSGATIGCRVDRCPKTYHLPCSRVEGCIFDHKKFLIACADHRHLFQARGNDYTRQVRKLKARKLRSDYRKLSNDAMRKDLDAEEKWLENCGEDEEFLKRESKRLHRDILRIAPIYIGGSSEAGKDYQGWESVAGLQDVIQCMKEVVILPLLYPEFFSNHGFTAPKGVLLHGYPGSGKTLVVRALIGACARGDRRIAYFYRKGADCLGKYVGDAERQLRFLFQVAERSQPSIIFFDEIDGLASSRSRQQDQTHNSVVSTLLSLMDGLKSRGSVMVIGATNRPDAVDPALRRPGRFDREIYFPLPSVMDRSSILSLHTKNWPSPLSGRLLSWIADQTAGYAGADLQSLCAQAAMSALKRSYDLHEVLCSAEKGILHGKFPSLPSVVVEERDWLTALASAPPPCSRREAGMAANDVVSSPLHGHLVPCLLEPLSDLLISFYLDDRIWLPPSLSKATECVMKVIFSMLEQRGVSTRFWMQNLRSLMRECQASNEIQLHLSSCGVVVNPSEFTRPCFSGNEKITDDDTNHLKFSQRYSLQFQNKSGFRVLISGAPCSGQQHLAGCVLHAFLGHIEIQKINLATILQEGHGDIIQGLTQILLKCRNAQRCLIYMPRIDLWAIDEMLLEESQVKINDDKPSASTGANTVIKLASEAWSSFLEQVDSMCISMSVIILATCEEPSHKLPPSIRQFFSNDELCHSLSSAHTVPRFSVLLDGVYDQSQVAESSSAELSQNLVQHYVQMVHCRSHMEKREKIITPRSLVDSDQNLDMDNPASDLKRGTTQSPLSNISSHHYLDAYFHGHQEAFPGLPQSKAAKGSLSCAITMFGYQILRYPQFAELCWITSKLKNGPCTDSTGPWKSWPFNSCEAFPNDSPSKPASGVTHINPRDKGQACVVRGLIAVGLLAFRGAYTNIGDVSSDVRIVLELLIEQINAKISAGKDRNRYLRLLSQVAYLEDMVNSWAYALQNLQIECAAAPPSMPSASDKRVCQMEEMPRQGSLCEAAPGSLCEAAPNRDTLSISNESVCASDPHNSDAAAPEKADAAEPSSLAPLPSSSNIMPSLITSQASNEGACLSGNLADSQSHDVGLCSSDDILLSREACSQEILKESYGLSASLPHEAQNPRLPEPGSRCLYSCCTGCLQDLHVVVREVLSDACASGACRSRVDDIHDAIASCSSRILAAIKRGNNSSEEAEFLPAECDRHAERGGEVTTAPDGSDRNFFDGKVLKLFFKGGAMMPLDVDEDAGFHCRLERLCLRYLVEKVEMLKRGST